VNVTGFLLVGMLGLEAASAAVWASGYAIEAERAEGTIAALFLAPVSRWAIIVGQGLAGFVCALPSVAVLVLVGVVMRADVHVAAPAALALSVVALLSASLSIGFALASLFVLTRHGNLVANVIQHPLYLLGGFIVPRSSLPSWLAPLSDALPIGHATDAFRDAALANATLGDVLPSLAAAFGLSALFAALGALLLRRVEYAAKRSGQLDFY
jgi:ABC-2 type transport system permease protein